MKIARQPLNATKIIELPSHLRAQETTPIFQIITINFGGQNLHYEVTLDQLYEFTKQTAKEKTIYK